MPKSRPSRKRKYRPPVYGKSKISAKPQWMIVTRIIMLIILAALILMAVAGYMFKYYRLISNHK